jgi:cholesterol oxidase
MNAINMRRYDAVVVGSGFGGAVAACRLSAAGQDVLVLERGRRWNVSEYPRRIGDAWFYDHARPYRRNGWFDMRLLSRHMAVVTGAGVGGGSQVFANVVTDAPSSAFDTGWPTAINFDVLKPYYERVSDMLRPTPIPGGQHPRRLEVMRSAAEAVGAAEHFRKVELAVTFADDVSHRGADGLIDSKPRINAHGRFQGTCTHAGHCMIGCKARAKNTLDLNYLAAAEDAGAQIRSLCQVSHISRRGDMWQIHFQDLTDDTQEMQAVAARRVILSAGSLGSTEILLRSRSKFRTLPNLPAALGAGWSANGCSVAFSRCATRRVSPTVGPTITSAIDYSDDPEKGFFIEDGGGWNWMDLLFDDSHGANIGVPFVRGVTRRLRQSFDFDSVMPWCAQAIDSGDGALLLGRHRGMQRDSLKLSWNPSRSAAVLDRVAEGHRRLAVAAGSRPLRSPHWSWFKFLITPHPLGGCNMAAAPAFGVVDHAGRVFGHPNLYVMDGSIIPRAIGRNPSKTIAAVAERAIDILVAEIANNADGCRSRAGSPAGSCQGV